MKKRMIAILLCVCMLAMTACGKSGETTENTEPEVEETVEELPQPEALSISLDGGYSIAFAPDVRDYEVKIPLGHPRLPKVSATAAAGSEVRVDQAVLPESANEGTAYVTVTDAAGSKGEYTVRFVRDEALGYQLQYGDVYQLCEDITLFAASYVCSDESVLTVSKTGAISALALSDSPVTVQVIGADGGVFTELSFNSVVKAPLNVFMIIGQSNAAGTYDIPEGDSTFTASQLAEVMRPDAGTVLCTDVSADGSIGSFMYDLERGRAGFSPALGKTWYDLTGEKTLMLQTAVGGAPIEAWLKPDGVNRYTYISTLGNFYETTKNSFDQCIAAIEAPDSGYELNRVHAYWLQGETGMASTYKPDQGGPGVGDWVFGSQEHILTTEEYYNYFMQIQDYLVKDFGCEFTGILLVRAVSEVVSMENKALQQFTDLVPPRAAQYALNNSNGTEIALVSRVCDIAKKDNWKDPTYEGYGMMGCNQVHYNQKGHNANGVAAAESTFNALYDRDGRTASEIEIIREDGVKRMAEGEVLELAAGKSFQTAAAVLPLYTDTPVISYKVADESVCTVDAYGKITAAADAAGKQTTVTYCCEAAGIEKTITVSVH